MITKWSAELCNTSTSLAFLLSWIQANCRRRCCSFSVRVTLQRCSFSVRVRLQRQVWHKHSREPHPTAVHVTFRFSISTGQPCCPCGCLFVWMLCLLEMRWHNNESKLLFPLGRWHNATYLRGTKDKSEWEVIESASFKHFNDDQSSAQRNWTH